MKMLFLWFKFYKGPFISSFSSNENPKLMYNFFYDPKQKKHSHTGTKVNHSAFLQIIYCNKSSIW